MSWDFRAAGTHAMLQKKSELWFSFSVDITQVALGTGVIEDALQHWIGSQTLLYVSATI